MVNGQGGLPGESALLHVELAHSVGSAHVITHRPCAVACLVLASTAKHSLVILTIAP